MRSKFASPVISDKASVGCHQQDAALREGCVKKSSIIAGVVSGRHLLRSS